MNLNELKQWLLAQQYVDVIFMPPLGYHTAGLTGAAAALVGVLVRSARR